MFFFVLFFFVAVVVLVVVMVVVVIVCVVVVVVVVCMVVGVSGFLSSMSSSFVVSSHYVERHWDVMDIVSTRMRQKLPPSGQILIGDFTSTFKNYLMNQSCRLHHHDSFFDWGFIPVHS